MQNNSTTKAYVAATSYAVIIGLSFLFSKVALQHASPVDLLAFRFTISFLAFLIFMRSNKIVVRFTLKRLLPVLPLALFYPLLCFGFQAFGLMYASSSEGGIIHASAPVFIMIFAQYFLGEKLNRAQKLSVFVSVTGVIYILVMTGAEIDFANLKGLFLLVGSVLFFSGYNILSRKLGQDYTNWELSFVMMTLSALVFVILSVGGHLWRGTLSSLLVPLQTPAFMLATTYLGVLSTLGSAMLTNYALSILEASRVSVFGNLGTIISLLAGVLFLQEKLYYYHFLGATLIILGVIGTNYFTGRTKQVKTALNQ